MFAYGDIILNILVIGSIIGAWATIFFRKSLIAAYLSTFSLVVLAIYAFKAMEHMEFYGWGYIALAVMMLPRIWMLQRAKDRENVEH